MFWSGITIKNCCLAPFGDINGCCFSDIIRIKWLHIRSQLVWSLTPPLIFQAFLLHLLYNLFIPSLATKKSQQCLKLCASYSPILDYLPALLCKHDLISTESFEVMFDAFKFLFIFQNSEAVIVEREISKKEQGQFELNWLMFMVEKTY